MDKRWLIMGGLLLTFGVLFFLVGYTGLFHLTAVRGRMAESLYFGVIIAILGLVICLYGLTAERK